MNVLILGVGGNVGQGIIKALKMSPLNAVLYGACISAESAGLYMCDKQVISPYANSISFIDWLIDYCNKNSIKVILSGVEEILEKLSSFKTVVESSTSARIIVSEPEKIDICLDKFKTAEWLRKNNLNAPKTYRLCKSDDYKKIQQKLGDQFIAKPVKGKGSFGITKVEDENAFIKMKRDMMEDMVVQEYLGDDSKEFTAAAYCDRFRNYRGVIIFKRTLFSGTTYKAEIVKNELARKYIQELVSKLKPMGPCNIQFRMHKNKPVCFEINLRFSGTTPVRAHFGFNDVEYSIRDFFLNENLKDLEGQEKGHMFRIWDEVYPDEDSFNLLSKGDYSE